MFKERRRCYLSDLSNSEEHDKETDSDGDIDDDRGNGE